MYSVQPPEIPQSYKKEKKFWWVTSTSPFRIITFISHPESNNKFSPYIQFLSSLEILQSHLIHEACQTTLPKPQTLDSSNLQSEIYQAVSCIRSITRPSRHIPRTVKKEGIHLGLTLSATETSPSKLVSIKYSLLLKLKALSNLHLGETTEAFISISAALDNTSNFMVFGAKVILY